MLSNGTWQPTYEVGTRGCWWKRCCAPRSSLCLECRPVSSRCCCCLVLSGRVTLEIPKVSALIRHTISVQEAPTPQNTEQFCRAFLLLLFFRVYSGVTTSQSCASIEPCALFSVYTQIISSLINFCLWSFYYYLSFPVQVQAKSIWSLCCLQNQHNKLWRIQVV